MRILDFGNRGRSMVAIVFTTVITGFLLLFVDSSSSMNPALNNRILQTNSNARKKRKTLAVGDKKMDNSKRTNVPAGDWGGDGIRLVVEAGSVKIEYACAHGEITESLKIDKAGNFRASGRHTPEMGGPVRLDNPPKAQRAVYTGRISGKSMTLKVALSDSNTTVGDFKLDLGKAVRIHRCM